MQLKIVINIVVGELPSAFDSESSRIRNVDILKEALLENDIAITPDNDEPDEIGYFLGGVGYDSVTSLYPFKFCQ